VTANEPTTTPIGILCEGTFKPSDFDSDKPPQISGKTLVSQSFLPRFVGITESITATFESENYEAMRQAVIKEVETCGDLVLLQNFGEELPGIPAQMLAANNGWHPVTWPAVHRGVHATMHFGIERSALHRIQPPLGFTWKDLVSVHVRVRVGIFGPRIDDPPVPVEQQTRAA
jgi:hypothetical protein